MNEYEKKKRVFIHIYVAEAAKQTASHTIHSCIYVCILQ